MNNGNARRINAKDLRGHLGERSRVGRKLGTLGEDNSGFYLSLLHPYTFAKTGDSYRIRNRDRIALTEPMPQTFEYTGK